jgi:hypothetical protein
MPDLPLPLQTDVTIQNQTTGQVDYLKYEGSTLVASDLFDYSLGSDFKIVASTQSPSTFNFQLVAQSASTGRVDFLTLDATGHQLIASAMSSVGVPRIVGLSDGIGSAVGNPGGLFASQLPDGELDFLSFNTDTGALTASDLLPGTAGLPHAVGTAVGTLSLPEFQGLGTSDTVVTQLADGSIDLLGFNGTFGTTLAYTASYLLAGSAGMPAIGAVNQNLGVNQNLIESSAPQTEGLQLIGQTAGGQPDVLYYDTGKNDPMNAGLLYATNLLNTAFPGWNVVDGGLINHSEIFPIS